MFYSQKSYTTKLGTCNDSIAKSGCALVSACNLFPRLIDFKMTPLELNDYCIKKKIYSNGCMMDFAKLANAFGLDYVKTTTKPKTQCIAETNFYANKGVPQHFYLWKTDNSIIDPLDKAEPQFKPNPYNVVSYRVFSVKQTLQQTPVQSEVELPPNKIYRWCFAIRRHEGWFLGSASYRNNNPGNFRCSSLVMGELGATSCVNNLAVFPNYETGLNALRQFLIYACTDKLRAYKSSMTLLDFYKVYAPSSDNNNPLNYATAVANELGVKVDTKISELYKNQDATSPLEPPVISEPINVPPIIENATSEPVVPKNDIPAEQTQPVIIKPMTFWQYLINLLNLWLKK